MAQDRNPQSDFDLTSIYNEINESFRVRLGLPSQEAPAPPILTQEQISQRKRIVINFLKNFTDDLVIDSTPPDIDKHARELKEKFSAWKEEKLKTAQDDLKPLIQSIVLENLTESATEVHAYWSIHSDEISINATEAQAQLVRWSITIQASEAASKLE